MAFELKELNDDVESLIEQYSHPLYVHVMQIIKKKTNNGNKKTKFNDIDLEHSTNDLDAYLWYLQYLRDHKLGIPVVKLTEFARIFAKDREYDILNDVVDKFFPELTSFTDYVQSRTSDEGATIRYYYYDQVLRVVKGNGDEKEYDYLNSLVKR